MGMARELSERTKRTLERALNAKRCLVVADGERLQY
jgi:putative SOS response-associated peptidase YedK